MPITHVIYHIPGRKVGCTKNLRARKKQYRDAEGVVPEIEVLAELHDKTDQEAGDIERLWSRRFRYYKGTAVHYAQTIEATNAPGAWRTLENQARLLRSSGFYISDRCPHCGMESNRAILHRWHFDNCLKKPFICRPGAEVQPPGVQKRIEQGRRGKAALARGRLPPVNIEWWICRPSAQSHAEPYL